MADTSLTKINGITISDSSTRTNINYWWVWSMALQGTIQFIPLNLVIYYIKLTGRGSNIRLILHH